MPKKEQTPINTFSALIQTLCNMDAGRIGVTQDQMKVVIRNLSMLMAEDPLLSMYLYSYGTQINGKMRAEK
jgi:hypothetical protein